MSGTEPLVPERVGRLAARDAAGRAWLEALPELVAALVDGWGLDTGPAFAHDGYTAVVLPATTAAGDDAVLKLAFPHMEGRDEAAGLRFWDGDPTVRLLAHDEASGAMLLERCRPGHDLNVLPEEERDVVLARLVPRLWRRPPEGHGFRHLSEMIAHWTAETLAGEERWPDAALVREGLAAWAELSRPAAGDVLLGTDVHAGNVLAAEREPWLVIDPKPFVGDPAYDANGILILLLALADNLRESPEAMADLPELAERITPMQAAFLGQLSRWATEARHAEQKVEADPRPTGSG